MIKSRKDGINAVSSLSSNQASRSRSPPVSFLVLTNPREWNNPRKSIKPSGTPRFYRLNVRKVTKPPFCARVSKSDGIARFATFVTFPTDNRGVQDVSYTDSPAFPSKSGPEHPRKRLGNRAKVIKVTTLLLFSQNGQNHHFCAKEQKVTKQASWTRGEVSFTPRSHPENPQKCLFAAYFLEKVTFGSKVPLDIALGRRW